ncbi:MAG: HAD-IA family hydrolase [Lentisphaerae bacterium]|nr:HAD-IA family hydrolase [Lentisphaerota bacterium]
MTTASPDIRGVIFDMDGVLCDSEAFICIAAIEMFRRRYGIEVQPKEFLPFVGTGETRYLGGVAEAHGVTLQMPEDKVFTYEMYLEIIKGKLPPLGGVLDFVATCRSSGIRLAVASAADRMKVDGNLKEIGLPATTFDAVITGSDVTHHKPHPECFLAAAAAIGIAAEHCLVVEDAHNGVKAAKAAGAWCLGLTTSFPAEALVQSGADWTASDLAHVPAGIV